MRQRLWSRSIVTFLCVALALAALGRARVSSSSAVAAGRAVSLLPGAPGALSFGAARHRGKVTVYDDTFGDAVPEGITAGPDGALWFTDTGNDVIGRITVHGHFHQYVLTGNELSNGITTGPDGALWFTLQSSASGIGRITTSGDITLFADPGGSFPAGITAGPDGALWFAEGNGKVGRMTTSGKVTHFKVASSRHELSGITTGPDGALWVTDYVVNPQSRFSNHVFRLTTAGGVTQYTVGSGPAEICVGPDGAVWFTERGQGAIGQLTTTGRYTEFSVTKDQFDPYGIASGPDGSLWFTNFDGFGAPAIGRITPSGHMTFYGTPSGAGEWEQITAGPDGAMWMTSRQGPSAIGRVTTGSTGIRRNPSTAFDGPPGVFDTTYTKDRAAQPDSVSRVKRWNRPDRRVDPT